MISASRKANKAWQGSSAGQFRITAMQARGWCSGLTEAYLHTVSQWT